MKEGHTSRNECSHGTGRDEQRVPSEKSLRESQPSADHDARDGGQDVHHPSAVGQVEHVSPGFKNR